MISCLFHEPALRRHLEDGASISSAAQAHLNHCPRCREMLADHRRIIASLNARRLGADEIPVFLHARIMRHVQADSAPRLEPKTKIGWAVAFALVAIAAIRLGSWNARSPQLQTPTIADFPTTVSISATLPANPLEKEIVNLRADTLNAARALAASFLPARSSE